MKKIVICDKTINQLSISRESSLTFREKIEVAKMLDKLGVDIIELNAIENKKVDPLLIKSIVTAVNDSMIAVPVALLDDPKMTVDALAECDKYRLIVEAPVSPVRMEYVSHKKAKGMKEDIISTIKSCLEYTDEVEFVADDATRSDRNFLYDVLNEVTAMGIKHITLCDGSGEMLPEEFRDFIEETKKNVPGLKNVSLGVLCCDELTMADECTVAAAFHGADEIKAAAYPVNLASLENVARVIAGRGDTFDVCTGVSVNRIKNVIERIRRIASPDDNGNKAIGESALDDVNDDMKLNVHDDKAAVIKASEVLGYDLSAEDQDKVYEEFQRITRKKEVIGLKELDAIIASTAMQVPPTYKLEGYIVNTGHKITSMVHMRLEKDGELKEGISLGDGPIDAAILAIEQITGRHFEMEGFRIRAITEGGEATGETVVKLRSGGKLYSGRGLSTDIIGASIRAYLIALNKLLFEENAE